MYTETSLLRLDSTNVSNINQRVDSAGFDQCLVGGTGWYWVALWGQGGRFSDLAGA